MAVQELGAEYEIGAKVLVMGGVLDRHFEAVITKRTKTQITVQLDGEQERTMRLQAGRYFESRYSEGELVEVGKKDSYSQYEWKAYLADSDTGKRRKAHLVWQERSKEITGTFRRLSEAVSGKWPTVEDVLALQAYIPTWLEFQAEKEARGK